MTPPQSTGFAAPTDESEARADGVKGYTRDLEDAILACESGTALDVLANYRTVRRTVQDVRSALTAAEARIAGLEAALEPFAVGTDIFFSGDADDRTVSIGRWYGGGPMSQELPRFNADIALTVGDFRRARAAQADLGQEVGRG